MERNEVCASIDHGLRQFVLNGKAILSDDEPMCDSHNFLMAKAPPHSDFLPGFLGRVAAARRKKFPKNQIDMCIALGWRPEDQSKWAKYETKTKLPHELIDQVCKICDVSMEWLLTGRGAGPAWAPVYPTTKTRQRRPKKKIVRVA